MSNNTQIRQEALRDCIEGQLGKEDWVTVYESTDIDSNRPTFFSYLFPEDKHAEVLKTADWEKHIGDGLPGIITYYQEGKEESLYFRYGDDDGFEPLVIYREHPVSSGC
jgi:hypothetical protein